MYRVTSAIDLVTFSVSLNRTYTAKNISFCDKITGNQLPVHFPLFVQEPVNIFRNQSLYGSKGHVLFLVI